MKAIIPILRAKSAGWVHKLLVILVVDNSGFGFAEFSYDNLRVAINDLVEEFGKLIANVG